MYPARQSNPSSLVSSTMNGQMLGWTWKLEKKNRLKSSKIEDCAKIETDFEKLSKLKKKLTLTDYEMYPAQQSNPSSLVSSTMDGQMLWWTWKLKKRNRLKSSKIEDCAKIETNFEKLSKLKKKTYFSRLGNVSGPTEQSFQLG